MEKKENVEDKFGDVQFAHSCLVLVIETILDRAEDEKE